MHTGEKQQVHYSGTDMAKQKYQSSFIVNECQTFSVLGHAIEHDLTFSI